MARKYSQEEIDFLKENAQKYTYKELAIVFNKKFNTSKSIDSIQQMCMKKLKIKAISEKIHYSEEEKQFLIDNIGNHSYAELAVLFSKKFKRETTKGRMSDVCSKQLKILRNKNTGQFLSEKRPKYEVGDEITRKDGYILVKYNDEYFPGKTTSEDYRKNWILKQKLIYERKYGQIKDNEFIVFLDKNKYNFDIDNLYCVNRKVHGIMCSNNWYTDNPEFTLTAINYCELMIALKV